MYVVKEIKLVYLRSLTIVMFYVRRTTVKVAHTTLHSQSQINLSRQRKVKGW